VRKLIRLRCALPGATPPAAAAVTADAVVEDLQAQVVSQTPRRRPDDNDAAEKYRAVARSYLDALAQLTHA
jgi:hypothetical protein